MDPFSSHQPQPQPQEAGRAIGPEAMAFVKQNVRAVSIIGGLVILVALIAVAYIAQQRRNSETAMQMLGVAQSPKQLEELLAQYPSSSAAPIALLALASGQYAAGAYDQALSLYGRFLQQYPKYSMAVAAELGKVMCQEARGETEPALAGFVSFITTHPDHFLLPQALMGKGRCLQQLHRAAEAKAVYEDFIAAHPDSEWNNQMEMELRILERGARAPPPEIAPISFTVPGQ